MNHAMSRERSSWARQRVNNCDAWNPKCALKHGNGQAPGPKPVRPDNQPDMSFATEPITRDRGPALANVGTFTKNAGTVRRMNGRFQTGDMSKTQSLQNRQDQILRTTANNFTPVNFPDNLPSEWKRRFILAGGSVKKRKKKSWCFSLELYLISSLKSVIQEERCRVKIC